MTELQFHKALEYKYIYIRHENFFLVGGAVKKSWWWYVMGLEVTNESKDICRNIR